MVHRILLLLRCSTVLRINQADFLYGELFNVYSLRVKWKRMSN